MGKFNFLYRTDLPHRAVSVYIYLADRANKNGECWPAIPTIARELKLSQTTVRRALDDLRKEGLLETEQRYRRNGGKSSLLFKIRKRSTTSTLTQQITGLRLEPRWSYSGLFPALLRQVLRPGEQVLQEGQAGFIHMLRDLGQQVFQVFVDLKPIRLGCFHSRVAEYWPFSHFVQRWPCNTKSLRTGAIARPTRLCISGSGL